MSTKVVYLTQTELRQLLTLAKAKDHDTWLMLLVGYWHGLRISEIINLKGNQISGGFLTVKRLKGSMETTQPLINHNDPLFNEKIPLEELAKINAGPLFTATRFALLKRMQKLCVKAGIPEHKRFVHVLKHTCAMHYKDMGIENLRQYLGHTSIASTGEYLKVNDETACNAFQKVIDKTFAE